MKKSLGRQKVKMVKMEKESNLQVTFSKRRSGLFKKASELCTLCGADVAIIVFSPGDKVFSFGHPSVDAIVDRFLARDPPITSGTMQMIEAHRNANMRDLNLQLMEILDQLELEKKRGEELDKMRKANQTQCWWEAPIGELNLPQLKQLRASLDELKQNVLKQADKLAMQLANTSQFYAPYTTGPPMVPFDLTDCGFNQNEATTLNANHGVFNPNTVPSGFNFGYGQGIP